MIMTLFGFAYPHHKNGVIAYVQGLFTVIIHNTASSSQVCVLSEVNGDDLVFIGDDLMHVSLKFGQAIKDYLT